MNTPVDIDADEFCRRLREQSQAAYQAVRAGTTDPEQLAILDAQQALSEALEPFHRVFIGLRMAGTDDKTIAALSGLFVGWVILAVCDNSSNPRLSLALLQVNASRAATGEGAVASWSASVPARPMGRA